MRTIKHALISSRELCDSDSVLSFEVKLQSYRREELTNLDQVWKAIRLRAVEVHASSLVLTN